MLCNGVLERELGNQCTNGSGVTVWTLSQQVDICRGRTQCSDRQWRGVSMVYVRPDIEAGIIQDQADVPPPPLPSYEADETDEEPDVEDIEVNCQVRSEENFTRGNFGIFKKILRAMLGKLWKSFDEKL